jgi:hypothetical protein
MRWHRRSQLESGFANVYDARGLPVIVAEPVAMGELSRLLQKAYYEHGLRGPEYVVFQSEEQALDDAEARRQAHEENDAPAAPAAVSSR